jgi:hypothetical protein
MKKTIIFSLILAFSFLAKESFAVTVTNAVSKEMVVEHSLSEHKMNLDLETDIAIISNVDKTATEPTNSNLELIQVEDILNCCVKSEFSYTTSGGWCCNTITVETCADTCAQAINQNIAVFVAATLVWGIY